MAVQTIKAIARRRWQEGDESRKFSWYEPIRDPDAIARAVRFVLAEEDLFLNTSSDATLLPLVLAAADGLDEPIEAPDDDAMAADIAAFDVEPLFDGGDLERI